MVDLCRIFVSFLVMKSFGFCKDLSLNGTSLVSMLSRKSKANILSFEPSGEDIIMGLDYLLPFLTVPIVREADAYGKEPALININAAAISSTGILAASSALVSYLFRKYVVFEPAQKSQKNQRSGTNFETEMWSMLNNLKFVYKNSTGAKIDTSLPGLFDALDEMFQQHNIDLRSCLQKAICQRLHQATAKSYDADATGLDKIIDGVTSIKWVQKKFLRLTSLNDVIGSRTSEHCDLKYASCKWSSPVDSFGQFFQTYLKFN